MKGDDGLTVASCLAFCSEYPLFGVEYGRECYCGTTRLASSQLVSDQDCSFSCAGDNAETCGAGNRIEIYTNDAFGTPSTPAGDESDEDCDEEGDDDDDDEAFTYSGCFQDTAERILPKRIIATNDMTPAKCAANCDGYGYFGLQYSSECYCGNAKPKVSLPEAECNMACSGDKTIYCGSGMKLSVYTLPKPAAIPPTNTEYKGCYADHDTRVLPGKTVLSDGMTPDVCAIACAGYNYFGVEYGKECYCGAQLSTASEKVSEEECTMSCGGDDLQICGDKSRLNVYRYTDAVDPTIVEPAVVGDFAYKSCWTDNVADRSLKAASYASDDMSLENCAAFCSGYKYFGVEFATECYCGNEVIGQEAAEVDCSMECKGNSNQWCGSGVRLNLYESTVAAPVVSSSAVVSAVVSSAAVVSSSAAPASSVASSSVSSFVTSTISASSTPVSVAASTSSAAPTETTVVTCPTRPVWLGTPTECWSALPSACNALNTDATLTIAVYGGNAILSCRNAFAPGLDLLPAIAACFPTSYPTQWGAALPPAKPIYDCLMSSTPLCDFSSACVTSTYPIGAAPTSTGTTAVGTNVIQNGGWESGTDGWTLKDNFSNGIGIVKVSNVRSKSGANSLRITDIERNSASWDLLQTIHTEPGATYRASLWWYQTNPAVSCGFGFTWNYAYPKILEGAAYSKAANQWVYISSTFVATKTTAVLDVSFNCNAIYGVSQDISIDDLEIVKIA
ncbi:WSC domain-containing protein [Cercophora scortea]|uniref:WSC domain-containing protein n=1 Tax=Cercophora scortea TaxID=314031 RepID=A0AAE0IDM8_9PEZI|nr:WSC domain-containing protein [Cercophora scortea]